VDEERPGVAGLDEQYVGIIVGVVVTCCVLLLLLVTACVCVRRRHLKYNNNHRAIKSIQPPPPGQRCNLITMNLNDLHAGTNAGMGVPGGMPNGKLISKSNGMLYNCVAQSDSVGDKDDGGGGGVLYKLDNLSQAAAAAGDYGYGIQTRKLPEPPARTPASTGTHSLLTPQPPRPCNTAATMRGHPGPRFTKL
jgi:hypothetical protein